MATRTEVTERPSQDVRKQEVQRAREPEAVLRPPVDIFEDGDGLTLIADMPGVSRDRLNVRIERDSLVVEGDMQFEVPEQMKALHADIRSTHYERRFVLSKELDADSINATLTDGVLTVRIPTRAELKPRRIEVSV